jgi:hypothetical protein
VAGPALTHTRGAMQLRPIRLRTRYDFGLRLRGGVMIRVINSGWKKEGFLFTYFIFGMLCGC